MTGEPCARVRVEGDDEHVLQFVADAVTLPALDGRVQLAGVSDPYPDRAGRGIRRYVDLVVVDNSAEGP